MSLNCTNGRSFTRRDNVPQSRHAASTAVVSITTRTPSSTRDVHHDEGVQAEQQRRRVVHARGLFSWSA